MNITLAGGLGIFRSKFKHFSLAKNSRCKPEIMNSDQGSHFTNTDYLELLEKAGVKVSMDGKGRATDNSRTERYFRSLKYECIFLNEFEDSRVLR